LCLPVADRVQKPTLQNRNNVRIRLKKLLYPIGAFLLASLMLATWFGDVMLQPNSIITEAGGDGLKNHFVFAHYVKNDTGFHFSGMNYPYGEHIFYPDQQPIVTVPLSFIQRNIASVAHLSVGISNVLMLYSVGFCAVFLFLILRKFNLPPWYSLVAAALIAALSPQIYRFAAHQALGSTVYIPMLWYFLLQWEDQPKKWLWGIGIVLTILVFGGLHLYYLPLGTLFLMAYGFVLFLANIKHLKTVFSKLAALAFMAILPIVLFQILITATDPMLHTRIQNPWGFFHYVAQFESIFLPYYTPFSDAINYFIKLPAIRFEGYGSIGIIGLLVFLLLIIRSFRFLLKRKPKRLFRLTGTVRLNHYIWSATLLLLFSMGVPFIWGMEWLLEILPKIKQFRSIGRFNWAFFYVFMVYASLHIYLIYKKIHQKSRPILAYSFIGLVFVLWSVNDYTFLEHARTYNSNAFKTNTFHQEKLPYIDSLHAKGYQITDFQAMVGLPFYHRGSDKVRVIGSALTLDRASIEAYNLGLPMLNSYIARSPIGHSMNVGQLFSDTILPRMGLQDFPNQKPLLAVFYDDPNQPLSSIEQHYIHQSEYITSYENYHFYKMPLSILEHNNTAQIQRFENRDSLFDYQWKGDSFAVSDTAMSFFHYNDFENGNSDIAFTGNKGISINDGGDLELYNGKIDLDSGEVLTITVWLECDYRQANAKLYHEVLGKKGQVIGLGYANHSLNFQDGWLRIEYDLRAEPSIYSHRIVLRNPKIITADALLMYPKGTDVYFKHQNGRLMWNNFPLK
jgi:hypothetical protein